MELAAGARVGPYEVLSRLGAGGMGEVWKARDTRLGRIVAIKTSTDTFSERFEREARAVAALNHPNVCTLYDVGPDYLVMEYVEGVEIKGPLPLDVALMYATQLASALVATHRNGTTHRDLKPANVLVGESGVKLLDFGLAKVNSVVAMPDGTRPITLTQAGMIMGTASYMSPEQATGDAVDSRSDIFSFGVLLYEVVSGQRAFVGDSFIDTMAAILRDEPPVLDAPAEIRTIVHRCMQKDPAERYSSMEEVRAALMHAAGMLSSQGASTLQASIAVLPFTNLSADKENEYFSDGLAEEILNVLSKTPDLRVIARTSSFAFRGKEQNVESIARALKVAHILTGSVRRSGNRVRVTAGLVEAPHGTQVWSERYDRDMTDVFDIQDEIAEAIAHALKVRLTRRTRAVNVDAWEHWLKGNHCRARNTPDNTLKAQEHFARALAIDPDYAQAHSGIALCYYVLALMGVRPVAEMQPLAMQAAGRALAIDPGDSESHMVLAVMAAVFGYDWSSAGRHFQKALSGDSVSPRSYYTNAMHFLVPQLRTTEAIAQSRRAVHTDPLSALFRQGVIGCLYADGQYDAAIRAGQEGLEIDLNAHLVLQWLGFAQMAIGDADGAVGTFRRYRELAPWENRSRGFLAAALHNACHGDAARELVSESTGVNAWSLGEAVYFAIANDRDAMFTALDGAILKRDLSVASVRTMHVFDKHRDDTRFAEILARMNLS